MPITDEDAVPILASPDGAANLPLYIERRVSHDPLPDISDMTSAQNFLHCQAVQFFAETNVDPDCTSNKVVTFP